MAARSGFSLPGKLLKHLVSGWKCCGAKAERNGTNHRGAISTKDGADAVAALIAQYVDTADICIFHNNPPRQYGTFLAGGDEAVDPGAEGAGQSAAGAAVAVAAGLTAGAISALGGPVVALAAAATGAYAGSLVGALHGLGNDDDKPHAPEPRPGNVILSVRIANPENEKHVIATLRSEGAADIEQAEGEWHDGDWLVDCQQQYQDTGDDWQKHGSIGTSHPSIKKKTIKQAVAIELNLS